MWFQERDGQIISAIYTCGGVLARRHIQLLFWPEKSLRAMQKRLSLLVKHGYLARVTKEQWQTKPIPEAIYWVGSQGTLWLAGQYGLKLQGVFSYPLNENRQRNLEKQCRQGGITWLREPKWFQLSHDLAIVDFRLRLEMALLAVDTFYLDEWHHEHHFRADLDVIEWQVTNRDGTTAKMKKGVCPDGAFTLVNYQRQGRGLPAKARFLLEMDGATHSNPKFGRDKVAAGVAYIQSPQYKNRFGANVGRWLVVTRGDKRLKNLMRQTSKVLDSTPSPLFYFTTMENVQASNVLIDPIWWQPGYEKPVSLLAII